MSTQLRIHQMKDGRLDEFLVHWRTQIAPLLEQFGFRIDGAWTVLESNQFAYLLSYDGPEGFDVRNQQFASSPERAALGIDPDEYLDSVDKFVLNPI